jgi:outer membrane protein OmpA-like peptidoglycan-associated protein
MKYRLVATTFVCALGAHGAFAQNAPSDDPNATSDTTKTTTRTTATTDINKAESTDLLFDTASADLKSGADAKLKELADWANCNPKGALILEGHADPRGTQAFNMELSAKRAATVREKLVGMGVRSDRIVISVYGENGPSRGSLQADRRVTVRPAETPVQAAEITPQPTGVEQNKGA